MTEDLLDQLGRGAVAVTANNRLARALAADFDAAMARRGLAVWPRPRALPWEAWLASLWDETWSERTLLAQPLVEVLWEAVVGEAAGEREILDIAATARAAAEARRLQAFYRLPDGLDPFPTEEEAAFAAWNARVEEALSARGRIDGADLPEAVARAFRARTLAPPERVVLVGFDEMLPMHRRVLDALVEAGGAWSVEPFPRRAGNFRLASLPDREAEWRAAAFWAREILEKTPSARLGIVAVDLEADACMAERTLAEALDPAALVPDTPERPAPFDLSLGRPLSGEPVAACALALLSALRGPLDPWEWRNLLLSPFWGGGAPGAEGLAERAAAWPGAAPTLEGMARLAATAGAPPTVRERLLAMTKASRDRRKKPPSEFSKAFWEFLETCGWAANVSLNSREFQAAAAFRDALARLGSFDAVAPSVSADWSLARLRRLAVAPFRPEGFAPSVQVLGLLEASGLAFDHLWVLGMGENSLPRPPRPTPFLSIRRQVAAGVRQATPEGELRHAQAVLERLLKSADEGVVSHSRMLDGSPSGPCRLLEGLPPVDREPPAAPSLAQAVALAAPSRAEKVPETPPPLGEGEAVRGGVRLLADQAECPFRAFARHRLGLALPEEPGDGFSASEQGVGVHEALHALHRLFPSRSALEQASAAQRDEAVALAAREGVERIARKRRADVGETLLAVEEARLRSLLRSWISLELERPDFEVLERETAKRIVVGGLALDLCIDRLDRQGEGCLLIDYKTGANNRLPSSDEERLVAPQLPLYALAVSEARGVCYAELDRGECTLKGIGSGETITRGVKEIEDWGALVEDWRRKLDAVALEFRMGRADVDPVKDAVCRLCGILPLCRYQPSVEEEDS